MFPKNVSQRSYTAHQNYVGHKKHVVVTKKSYVTPQKETHIDWIYLMLHRKEIHVDQKSSCCI